MDRIENDKRHGPILLCEDPLRSAREDRKIVKHRIWIVLPRDAPIDRVSGSFFECHTAG